MRITDPKAMRAMAHPLRLDLIELLGTVGTLTAAACARRLGSSQANCSFHLRQLAKYGFVEQAAPSGDSRERPWRLTDIEQSWSTTDGGAAATELERVFVQREADRILAWQSAGAQVPEQWRRASFVGGATLPVTVDELEDLRNRMHDLLGPYVERLGHPETWPDGHRFVRILLAGTPVGHLSSEGLNRESSTSSE
jgi:hypothetical protein